MTTPDQRAALRTLARAHVADGEHEAAAEQYRNLIRAFQGRAGNATEARELREVLEEAGECWLEVGRPQAAIDVLLGAVTRWRPVCADPKASAGDLRRLINCLQLTAQAHHAMDRPRDAGRLQAEINALELRLVDAVERPDEDDEAPESSPAERGKRTKTRQPPQPAHLQRRMAHKNRH